MMYGCRTPLLLVSVFYSICFYFLFCTNTVEAFLVVPSESRTTTLLSSSSSSSSSPSLNHRNNIIQPVIIVNTLRTQYLYNNNNQQQSRIRKKYNHLLYCGGQNQEVPNNKADNNSAASTTARRRSVSFTDTLSSNTIVVSPPPPPPPTTTTHNNNNNNELKTVTSLTEIAIYRYDSEEGLHALRELNKLCQRRLSYHFDDKPGRRRSIETANQNNDDDNNDDRDTGERVIALVPNLLPTTMIHDLLEAVQYMEQQEGWISTNPDSVDGRPSLHVNVVSDATPFFHQLPSGSCYRSHLQQLYELVRPYVYEKLYQEVDRLLNENNNHNNNSGSTLRVSDIFLRRYGENICGEVTRNSISMHYDVFSRITAVIALDEVASQGTNGLFTLVSSVNDDDEGGDDDDVRQAPTTSSSSHKALRRYFPLSTGDCVVHTWDVLHGVDVEPGLDRTSLIVWFDEEPIQQKNHNNNTNENEDDDEYDNDNNTNNGNNNNDNEDQEENGMVASPILSPWLFLEHQQNTPTNRTTLEDGNDVRQFVLASALASSSSSSSSSSIENTTTTSTTTTTTTTPPQSETKKEEEIRLYLRSAAQRNTFALTRMGSLCEEGTLKTCFDVQQEAFSMVEQLRPFDTLPLIMQEILQQGGTDERKSNDDDDNSLFELACRFWFEAAVQGNSLPQKALADEVMFVASQSGDANQRLFAAVLFALACQQEDDDTPGTNDVESSSSSSDSLSRVIQYDSAARKIENQEEFLASPVVQVAQASGFDF